MKLSFLEVLYHEHENLSKRISMLKEMIDLYEDRKSSYPLKSSWKDRILFSLNQLNRPSTAKEIANYIYDIEKGDYDHIRRMAAQYSSIMGLQGFINVDNKGFRNKYSIKYGKLVSNR